MRLASLVLVLFGSGCLDAFTPDQSAATGDDAAVPAVGGGPMQETPAPHDDGGAVEAADGGSKGAIDDAGSALDGSSSDLASSADLAPNCINLTTANGDGHHNAGTDCLTCHNGAAAPLFTVAGTLYTSINGGTPIAGATIRLTDGKGTAVDLVTGTNGNFYGTGAVAFPVTARASGCPNDAVMSAQVQSTGGSCNGCHGTGNRVHLP
jgi:hypothetical protein